MQLSGGAECSASKEKKERADCGLLAKCCRGETMHVQDKEKPCTVLCQPQEHLWGVRPTPHPYPLPVS